MRRARSKQAEQLHLQGDGGVCNAHERSEGLELVSSAAVDEAASPG